MKLGHHYEAFLGPPGALPDPRASAGWSPGERAPRTSARSGGRTRKSGRGSRLDPRLTRCGQLGEDHSLFPASQTRSYRRPKMHLTPQRGASRWVPLSTRLISFQIFQLYTPHRVTGPAKRPKTHPPLCDARPQLDPWQTQVEVVGAGR